MSGPPRVRSMKVADSESKLVLGVAGNKAQRSMNARKQVSRTLSRIEISPEEGNTEEKKGAVQTSSPPFNSMGVPSILCRQVSLNASCSSDASTDSFQSRASTGRIYRTSSNARGRRQLASKPRTAVVGVSTSDTSPDGSQPKKRCSWVTSNTDQAYATFHDEEWGVPVHDDKKLFELLVLSGALSELTWPAILSKRHIFREVFAEFDPIVVGKFNEKKLVAPGSTAISLLSDLKIRAIVDNARQISKTFLNCGEMPMRLATSMWDFVASIQSKVVLQSKVVAVINLYKLVTTQTPDCPFPVESITKVPQTEVIDEFGSFDSYIWSFVNYKPIISRFRYPRQVPVKTPKADFISKDLMRRGFRCIGPTVIYSFMQVTGITNDHLISCFRFQDCLSIAESQEVGSVQVREDGKNGDKAIESCVCSALEDLNFS